jgi:hypothetical protein
MRVIRSSGNSARSAATSSDSGRANGEARTPQQPERRPRRSRYLPISVFRIVGANVYAAEREVRPPGAPTQRLQTEGLRGGSIPVRPHQLQGTRSSERRSRAAARERVLLAVAFFAHGWLLQDPERDVHDLTFSFAPGRTPPSFQMLNFHHYANSTAPLPIGLRLTNCATASSPFGL